jgi:hypothetical protein
LHLLGITLNFIPLLQRNIFLNLNFLEYFYVDT